MKAKVGWTLVVLLSWALAAVAHDPLVDRDPLLGQAKPLFGAGKLAWAPTAAG